MKWMLILLLFPLPALAQTVHIQDEDIVYKGSVDISGLSAAEIKNRAVAALNNLNIKNLQLQTASVNSNQIETEATLRLNTPYTLIRTMKFNICIMPKENGYDYLLNNFVLTEEDRQGNSKTIKGKEMVENLEEAGRQLAELEKLLNETDMRMQQILVMLKKFIAAK